LKSGYGKTLAFKGYASGSFAEIAKMYGESAAAAADHRFEISRAGDITFVAQKYLNTSRTGRILLPDSLAMGTTDGEIGIIEPTEKLIVRFGGAAYTVDLTAV